MFYTIDRIHAQDSCAIAFDGDDNKINIPLESLPKNIKEGDILEFDGEKYIVNEIKTAEVKADIAARFERLLKKNK